MLAGINGIEDMGKCFAEGVYQLEIDYMINHELVKTGEDLLWRRTKLGLYLSADEQLAITDYIQSQSTEENVISLSKVS